MHRTILSVDDEVVRAARRLHRAQAALVSGESSRAGIDALEAQGHILRALGSGEVKERSSAVLHQVADDIRCAIRSLLWAIDRPEEASRLMLSGLDAACIGIGLYYLREAIAGPPEQG
jgi:hypothetical protein